MSAIRVLIVDASPEARDGLGSILGSDREIEITGFAADARAAMALVRELNPDLISTHSYRMSRVSRPLG